MAGELWGDCDGVNVKEHSFGKGKVIQGRTFEEIAASADLPPDMEYACDNPHLKLGWIHRSTGGADIYFLANLQMFPVDIDCHFRTSGLQPEFWHPDSGRIEDCVQFKPAGKQTEVPIHLDSKGSLFVIFRRPAMAEPVVAVHAPARTPIPGLTLLKATLSHEGKSADVTGELKPLVANGALDMGINHMFGGGPWDPKSTLDIEYSLGATTTKEHYFGFESLHVPIEDASQGVPLAASSKLPVPPP